MEGALTCMFADEPDQDSSSGRYSDAPAPGSRLARFLAVEHPVEAYLMARELVTEAMLEAGEEPREVTP